MFVSVHLLSTFVDQIVSPGNDVLIYHFYPAGSKKIANLQQVKQYEYDSDWNRHVRSFEMIIHDQEPLSFDDFLSINDDDVKTHTPFVFFDSDFLGKSKLWTTKGIVISDKFLLCHSELNSNDLVKYENHDAIGVYWWSHALIARDWYRYAIVDQRLSQKNHRYVKDFNVYNRAWSGSREYRLKFVDMILDAGILDNCNVKFSPHDSGEYYRDHIFKNPKLCPKNHLDFLPMADVQGCASADYSWQDYRDFGIDIVLETVFDDSKIHITEKTLRPIACGKPFMIAAGPGSLGYLRNYGFKTFSGIIDESYDLVDDSVERLSAIIKEMHRISSMNDKEKNIMYCKMQEISQYNREHFWSDRFVNIVVSELKKNFDRATEEIKKHQRGHYYIERRKLMSKHSPTLRKMLTTGNEVRTRQDIVELLKTIKLNSLGH
jgi:hypothetical protein